LEDIGIDGRIILKCILKKQDERTGHGTCSSGSMEGQMVDSCKHSTKPLGSINCGKF
jgi:hypothetical protein